MTSTSPLRNLWPIAALLATSAAVAEPSCGLRATQLFAGGKTSDLAALFAQPAAAKEPLQRLSDRLGKITDLEQTNTPRFAKHERTSIATDPLPNGTKYQGTWINAQSEKLGAVQFHVASAPGTTCKVWALHLDTARP